MSSTLKITFNSLIQPKTGACVIFVGDDLVIPTGLKKLIGTSAANALARAMTAENFKGKEKSALTLLAPPNMEADRLIVIGTGTVKDREKTDYVNLGGAVMGRLGSAKQATILFAGPSGWRVDAQAAADLSLGIRLRAYKFDKYKTKKNEESGSSNGTELVNIALGDVTAARKLAKVSESLAGGVIMARDLVNEPPNVLDPVEFAKRAEVLKALGVEITVLDEKQLAKIGMRALLGVGQGSRKESRVVIMKWNGAPNKKGPKGAPLAFIGKGVCFDTGGISIKPSGGMEDMKGDMAGAACVVGLMHALASRKAKVNVIGAIGLVENMPDGNAQRPGDIVTSLSGQTIEIINTDAEGRLVLGDVIWYVNEQFKPAFMVDLATLTGAILVALGNEHAGLFSNDDTLSERLHAVGQVTGERVWRMPLDKNYDKMIDSKFADMKNAGARNAGSITAAHFIKRFVGETPWAHLDIAGTAMSSPETDINKSWASGWGVRLLDRLVSDYYEI